MSRRLLAGVRYTAAVSAADQRLVGPTFAFLLAAAVTQVSGGGVGPILAETLAYLFPVGAWVTVVVMNGDADSSTAVAEAAAGGPLRLRGIRMLVAFGLCTIAASFGLLSAILSNASTATAQDLAAGAVALFLVCIGAVAAGSLCSRPLISRPGWVVAIVLVLAVIELVVPLSPPVGAAIQGLPTSTGHVAWADLGLGAVITLVAISVALLVEVRLVPARN